MQKYHLTDEGLKGLICEWVDLKSDLLTEEGGENNDRPSILTNRKKRKIFSDIS